MSQHVSLSLSNPFWFVSLVSDTKLLDLWDFLNMIELLVDIHNKSICVILELKIGGDLEQGP